MLTKPDSYYTITAMIQTYRFIRKSAGVVTLSRGVLYIVTPILVHLGLAERTVYESFTYKYMAYLSEWGWGVLFFLVGVGMIVPSSPVKIYKISGYRLAAMLSILLWVFTGTLSLFAFPSGAGWVYAVYFAFLSLVTFLRPDEDFNYIQKS